MDSIAITDHGVMYGCVEFYKAAKAEGIKPIIGCEVYVASKSRFDKENSPDNFYYHLVLLAENNKGYDNLIKIVSYGFKDGFYYKPRVDIELLEKYHEGIIALSACLAGPVARTIIRQGYDKAKGSSIKIQQHFWRKQFLLRITRPYGRFCRPADCKSISYAYASGNRYTPCSYKRLPLYLSGRCRSTRPPDLPQYRKGSGRPDTYALFQAGMDENDSEMNAIFADIPGSTQQHA